MPLDLAALVAPDHTALVLQEVQNGVVGDAVGAARRSRTQPRPST